MQSAFQASFASLSEVSAFKLKLGAKVWQEAFVNEIEVRFTLQGARQP